MKTPKLFAIALACLALFAVRVHSAAAAGDGPGTKAVRSANDTINGLLKQKVAAGSDEEKKLAAKVTTSVRDLLDVDELGKRALVDHWKDIPAAKQKDLLDTRRALIEDNYIKGLRANLEYTVDYTGESTQTDGSVLVTPGVFATRYSARPAVVCRTTSRFMRIGPAPITPRRPAVPNARRPPKRSPSSAAAVASPRAAASMIAPSSAQVSGSQSEASQARARESGSTIPLAYHARVSQVAARFFFIFASRPSTPSLEMILSNCER